MSEPLAYIKHKWYCNECWKYTERTIDCHTKPPLTKTLPCDYCGKLALKYKGGTDARVTTYGNCGYVSCEKGSAQNIKNMDMKQKEEYEQKCANDPFIKQRREEKKPENRPWWRKDMEKPLDLTRIKDVNKYIETGEKD